MCADLRVLVREEFVARQCGAHGPSRSPSQLVAAANRQVTRVHATAT
jgi:hypothetical protein